MHYETTKQLLIDIKKDIESKTKNTKNEVAKMYLEDAMQHLASAVFQLGQAEQFEQGTWELTYWKDKH